MFDLHLQDVVKLAADMSRPGVQKGVIHDSDSGSRECESATACPGLALCCRGSPDGQAIHTAQEPQDERENARHEVSYGIHWRLRECRIGVGLRVSESGLPELQ